MGCSIFFPHYLLGYSLYAYGTLKEWASIHLPSHMTELTYNALTC